MIDFIGSALPEASAAFVIAIDLLVKSAIVLAVSFVVHHALGRSRALARSALWQATLMGLIVLPFNTLAFPRLPVAVLPVAAMVSPVISTPLMSDSFPSRAASEMSSMRAETLTVLPVRSVASTGAVESHVANSTSGNGFGIAWLLVDLYVLVAVSLGIRLLAALWAVRDLRRACVPVDARDWNRALGRSCETLGISRRVFLLESDRISVPMVVGWFHPAVIVPRCLVRSAGPELIDAVLLHELAHIRRNDFAWNFTYKLLRLFYWPNPLIWPAGRLIGALREQACDDLCVHALGGAAAYRASLLEVAAGLVRRPELSLGLAFARATNLARRLAWIDVSPGKPRCILSRKARIGMAFLVLVVTGFIGSIEAERRAVFAEQVKAADEPKGETQPKPPPEFELVVLAKDTRKPLAGATVNFLTDLSRVIRKTGSDGVVRLDLTHRMFHDSLGFDVWAEGYVQQRYFFAQNDARYPKIPPRFSVELLPGEQTLGGKVTDEAGRPIAGVTVRIWGYLGEKKEEHELASYVDTTTNDRGQWRCRCFRSMTFAYIYLSHPDYINDDAAHPRRHGSPMPAIRPQPGDQPLAGLRDFSDVQVMKTGVSLAGKVVDGQNKPVAGAQVGWIRVDERHTSHAWMPVTSTNDAGRFRFAHVRPGAPAIQVTAKGYAPELKTLDAIDLAGHLTITLGPPRSLSGRVVDTAGKPIPDAVVSVSTWRGFMGSLGAHVKSDEDGRFHWDGAPPDEFMINVRRTGFMSLWSRQVATGEKSISVDLRRAFTISGRIKDAETDKPVDRAELDLGVADARTGDLDWHPDESASASQGRFSHDFDVEKTPEFRLRFRASGYEPFVSRVFKRDESQVEYDVKLKKAQ
jgi:beta-lactamase regulating signal transducer with metallopeptidase domain/protocatechuate 3,4-dioxygenase beta subunit